MVITVRGLASQRITTEAELRFVQISEFRYYISVMSTANWKLTSFTIEEF